MSRARGRLGSWGESTRASLSGTSDAAHPARERAPEAELPLLGAGAAQRATIVVVALEEEGHSFGRTATTSPPPIQAFEDEFEGATARRLLYSCPRMSRNSSHSSARFGRRLAHLRPGLRLLRHWGATMSQVSAGPMRWSTKSAPRATACSSRWATRRCRRTRRKANLVVPLATLPRVAMHDRNATPLQGRSDARLPAEAFTVEPPVATARRDRPWHPRDERIALLVLEREFRPELGWDVEFDMWRAAR
jgi:hypothetical protein